MLEMSFLEIQLHHGNGYNLHIPIVLKTLFSKFLVCGTISHDGSHIIAYFGQKFTNFLQL